MILEPFYKLKEVTDKILDDLKKWDLKIKGWRESPRLCAQIKMKILDKLQALPINDFTDEQLREEAEKIFKDIYESNL